VKRELTIVDALLVVMVLTAGTAMMSFALLALFRGYDVQAIVFACGGAYLALWSGIRLTGRPRD
jgi:hypothetical protein